MQHSKRGKLLEAYGWTRAEVEALAIMPVRQLVDDLEQAMCESGALRRILREVVRECPEARVIAVR